jgi:nucleotide-binding universal stress UspA family protein
VTIVVWLTEGTWPACVDAARALPAGPVRLLHVVDAHSVEAIDGAHAGLLGRAVGDGGADMLLQAQAALLDAAATRLGRPAERAARRGGVEREVVAACADADLLILARDGDRTRLGPKSLGRTTRFVLDHAPCPVLLVWPDAPPGLSTLPPPPR